MTQEDRELRFDHLARGDVHVAAENRMALATAISRTIGFGRVVAISAILGTTELASVFSASNSMSNVLFELLAGGALSAAIVPALVAADDRDGSLGMERVARGMLGIALSILAVATLGALAARGPLAELLTSATNPAARPAATRLVEYWLMWFLPQTMLYAWGAISIAVLTARRKLGVVGAAPIGNTVVLVICLVISRLVHGTGFAAGAAGLRLSGWEQAWLGLAGTGGVLAFVLIPYLAVRRARISLRPTWGWSRPELRKMLRAISWSVLQSGAVGVLLLGSNIASAERRGGAQIYAFALAAFYAPFAIFAQPVQTSALPDLARLSGDPARFSERLSIALRSTLNATVLIAVAALGLVFPAMRAVLFGATQSGDARGYAFALLGLLLGLPAYSVFMLLSRARYAQHDTRTPAIAAMGAAVAGAGAMQLCRALFDGDALLAAIGACSSGAWVVACSVLTLRSNEVRHAWRRLPWIQILRHSVLPGGGIAAAVLLLESIDHVHASRMLGILVAGAGGVLLVILGQRQLRNTATS